MNILSYTRRERSWQTGLQAESCEDALRKITARLCNEEFYQVNPELSPELINAALLDREKQRSTALGMEIAFPHARLENLKRAIFAVATLEKPVLFDGTPVRIICLILVPTSDPSLSLKMMAQLSRLLSDSARREDVLNAGDGDRLQALFQQTDMHIDTPLLARDIMNPPGRSVRHDTPVSQCAHLMSRHQLSAVPVLDDGGKIIGELTTEHLFRYGLPDFFSKLKSVSFIASFDPFEKYFEDERNTVAGDMMDGKARIIPPEYTIMEIVFDLAIKNHGCLYVNDQSGRWIGTVNQAAVLDNVINY